MLLGTGKMESTQVGAVTILNPYVTTMSAFLASVVTSFIIVAISRVRGVTPEAMLLSGVALGALFSAGTMFLQYFTDDTQLAAMVFWTSGDVGRAGWHEAYFMAVVIIAGLMFFILSRWTYNAIDAGDELARSLGIEVGRVLISKYDAFLISFRGYCIFFGHYWFCRVDLLAYCTIATKTIARTNTRVKDI